MKNFIWGAGPRFQNNFWFRIHKVTYPMELSTFMTCKNRDEREYRGK